MIVEADGIYYIMTGHAEGEMMMDGISPEEIKQAIENGDIDFTQKGDELYRLVIGKREIGVVVIPEHQKIRTVFVIT